MFLSRCYRYIKKFAPVVVLSITLGVLAYRFTARSLDNIIERSLINIAKQGAVTVENAINYHLGILNTIAGFSDIKDPTLSAGEKAVLLKKYADDGEALTFGWIDAQGMMHDTEGAELTVSGLPFYQDAMRGTGSVYKPDSEPVIIFTAPVFYGDRVEGAICATYSLELLCRIVENTRFGMTGYGFIIDNSGKVIAHPNRSLVEEGFNAIAESGSNPDLQSLAWLEEKMISGETDAGRYRFKNIDSYMGFTKIKGMPWYFAETTLTSEVYGGTLGLIIMIIAGIVAFIVLFLATNMYLAYLKRKIKENQSFLKTAVDAGNIISIKISCEGLIQDFNKNAEEQFRDKISLKKDDSIFSLLSVSDGQKLRKKIEKCFEGETDKNFELVFRQGRSSEHFLCAIRVCDSDAAKSGLEILGVNITERARKEMELRASHEELTAVYEELTASEEELKSQLDELIQQKIMLQDLDARYNLVVDASSIGIWDWDVIENKTYYSDKWYEIFGFSKDDDPAYVETWREYIDPEDLGKVSKAFNDHIEMQTASYESEFRYIRNGRVKWISAVGKGLWDSDGKLVRMAGAHTDITSKKEAEERIMRLAYHDPLTDLPNRIRLTEAFWEVIGKKPGKVSLIFMDIDNFKLVNDSYGHTIGDDILVEVARRLKEALRENMFLSRPGGDEYAILMWDYDSKDDITAFVEEIMKLVDAVINLGDHHINLSASIGIATYPDNAEDFDALLKNADTAMYKAKEKRNRYMFYRREMNEAIVERLNITNCLRDALDNDELMVYYQPQYRIIDHQIVGFEALLRWNSPKLGMVPPQKFIPIAEESKQINPIGEYVLRTAIAFLGKINRMSGMRYMMCINISIIQIMQKDFTETVLGILKEYGVPSELLELEITESVLMESIASVIHNIMLLRKAGVKIALDDFGTGYSSLNYLTQLPINTLKIDKSFIDNIGHVKEKSLLISTIVDIGRKLGLSIVAEGVEMQEQLDYLTRRRCDRVQGFLFSGPLPGGDIEDMVMKAVSSSAIQAING